MECKVSISIDPVFPLPLLISPHDYAPMGTVPPLPPPSPVGLALETIVNMYWPPGVLMGKTKFTDDKVKHGGFDLVLESHDCGPLIIHVQIAPASANVLTILHILGSKRKANFSAGEIKAKGKPIAHCILTNGPPLPMTNCGKPMSPPETDSPFSHANSLILGVHWIDIVAGALTIVVDVIWDIFTSRAPSTSQTTFGGVVAESAGNSLGGWIAGALTGGGDNIFEPSGTPAFGGDEVRRNVTGNIPGLVRLAGQAFFDYHGDARVGFTSSGGPYTAGVSYTHDGATGDHTIAGTQGVNLPFGAGGVSASEQVTIDSEGNSAEGRVRGSGNLGGASAYGQYHTEDGWGGSGSWPDL